jgi:hypothetical protein
MDNYLGGGLQTFYGLPWLKDVDYLRITLAYRQTIGEFSWLREAGYRRITLAEGYRPPSNCLGSGPQTAGDYLG